MVTVTGIVLSQYKACQSLLSGALFFNCCVRIVCTLKNFYQDLGELGAYGQSQLRLLSDLELTRYVASLTDVQPGTMHKTGFRTYMNGF